jgi:DNA-binding NtrC family response regulator/lipopolysaccharide biosynthesis regulator YciM
MGKELYLQELSIAEELVGKNDFPKAKDALGKLSPDSLAADEYAHYCLLFSEINLYLGQYDRLDMIENAIAYYKGNGGNDKYARAKYLFGKLLALNGKYPEAKEALIESYVTYKRCDDLSGCARTLNHLAYIAHICGDIESSIEHLKKCIEIYKEFNNQRGYLTLLNNLAVTYRRSGQLYYASEQYRIVSDAYVYLDDDIKHQFLIGYSAILALKGDTSEALESIHKTKELNKDYKREKALYYEYLGWINNIDNKFHDAAKNLAVALKLSLQFAPESDFISQTKRLLADAYFGLKKYDLAQKYAEEALAVAEKINERAEIAACYRVFAQVALHDGENDKAKEWFKKAIDLFAMIKSRYELAVTRYLCAISGLYDNGERSALLYLAKEYFESEEIKPYIDKVNAALADTGKLKAARKRSNEPAPVFIAASPKTKKILDWAEHFAPTDYTVLLTGPTGVGKDQLAKYIHWASGRKGRYIAFNCAAIPETMIEAELFGYRKGAYTGADSDKPGIIELADNGTLCLNEIAETPINFQTKLLDFLETKVIRPIGSTQFKRIDVRIIAATNQDLQAAMIAGRFREDLYYRLNQIEIFIPPLSERVEDIPELARYFLIKHGYEFSNNGDRDEFAYLCSTLSSCEWHGNVRELENSIAVQWSLSGGSLSRLADLIKGSERSERERLIRTLEETGWNQREAARMLEIDESTIRYRIKKFQLSK